MSYGHITISDGEITISYGHIKILYGRIKILYGHITIWYGHVTISYCHITQFNAHIKILYDHITISYDHINIWWDHITNLGTISQCYMIISPDHAMKSWDHSTKWKPKDTERPFKAIAGNRKPPKAKHSAPSSKSALKISKKICNFREKTGPRERWQEILRWKVAYALQVHFLLRDSSKPLLEIRFSVILSKIRRTGFSELQNLLRRRPFGRPIPVWGQ